METFAISPYDCLVVKALDNTRSLREAAGILGYDPATLVRKVKRISQEHGLLEKIKGRWVPTTKGRGMMLWAEESVFSQKARLDERPLITIAATTWMTESALIPNFQKLRSELRHKRLWSFRVPKSDFEDELLRGISDYAIVCHAPDDPAIVHKKIAPEKWVAIAPALWGPILAQQTESQQKTFLSNKPFIRHMGFNPGEILGIKLDNSSANFTVDSLVAIRAAVENGYGWSFVPLILINQAVAQNIVVIINLEIHLGKHICIWWRRGRKDLAQDALLIKSWLGEICL